MASKHRFSNWFYTLYLYARIFKMRMLWLFTFNRKHRVQIYETINDIPLKLKWGSLYKYDPPRDPVYHPTQIQKWLDLGKKIGDCDDHAIYWCTALLKSGLVKRVWFCMYFYETAAGEHEGHAICVFEGLDGLMYWGDYSTPNPVLIHSDLLPTKFDWLITAMKSYGAVSITSASMFEVPRINWRDTPVLKNPKFIGVKTLEDIVKHEV